MKKTLHGAEETAVKKQNKLTEDTFRFYKLYLAIYQSNLTKDQAFTLNILLNLYKWYAEMKVYLNKERRYHFYFTKSLLYKQFKMSESGFSNNLKWLKENGYVEYFSAMKGKYRYKTSYFFITDKSFQLVSKPVTDIWEYEDNYVIDTVKIECINDIAREIVDDVKIEDISNINDISNEIDDDVKIEDTNNINDIESVPIPTPDIVKIECINDIAREIVVVDVKIEDINNSNEVEVVSIPIPEVQSNTELASLKYLQLMKESLATSNSAKIRKATIESYKTGIGKQFSTKVSKKAWSKILQDKWFIVNGGSSKTYTITQYAKLDKVTLSDLNSLSYKELLLKAK
jgi:Fe-S cluster biosynthesis and repair protein YggX